MCRWPEPVLGKERHDAIDRFVMYLVRQKWNARGIRWAPSVTLPVETCLNAANGRRDHLLHRVAFDL